MAQASYETRKPIVFMAQPSEFRPVEPDGVKKWLEQMKAMLGEEQAEAFQRTLKMKLPSGGAWVESTSLCQPYGADDCDAHWHPEL
jgi:hypothetical protein